MFRVQGFFLVAPVFSNRAIPTIIKIGLSFMFCFWFYEAIFNPSTNIFELSPVSFLILIFAEFSIGFFIGILMNLVFDAILSLAHLLGTQFGMSSATVFNASVASPTNPTGIFFSTMALIFFVSFGGLYNISFVLRKSFEFIPMANYEAGFQLLMTNFAHVFSQIFIASLKFVLPLIVLMFVVDVFVAIFSKILPQASMFFLIMPNKLILAAILSIIFLVPYQSGLEIFFSETLVDYMDELLSYN